MVESERNKLYFCSPLKTKYINNKKKLKNYDESRHR